MGVPLWMSVLAIFVCGFSLGLLVGPWLASRWGRSPKAVSPAGHVATNVAVLLISIILIWTDLSMGIKISALVLGLVLAATGLVLSLLSLRRSSTTALQ